MTPPRIDWRAVLPLAANHARRETSEIGSPPSLRRIHYLLVSDPEAVSLGYVNRRSCYSRLSELTARARDAGTFPALDDQTRAVHHPYVFTGAGEAAQHALDTFALDRWSELRVGVALVVEKRGLVPMLRRRFDWLPVTSLSGYTSQTHRTEVAEFGNCPRAVVGLYLGDYDPSGLDIERNAQSHLPFPLLRVALTADQIAEHRLPEALPKRGDSRLGRMVASEGSAVQVEVDALPGAVLLGLMATAIEGETGVTIRDDGRPDLPNVDQSETEQRDQLRAALSDLIARGESL